MAEKTPLCTKPISFCTPSFLFLSKKCRVLPARIIDHRPPGQAGPIQKGICEDDLLSCFPPLLIPSFLLLD